MSKVQSEYGLQLLKLSRAIKYNIDCIETLARKKASFTHCVSTTDWDTTLNQIANIDKLLEHRDVLVYLQQCISESMSALPKTTKQLLTLVYIKKMCKDEVAMHMGYSTRTLYRRMDYAKEVLHRELRNRGISYQWLIDNIRPVLDIVV